MRSDPQSHEVAKIVLIRKLPPHRWTHGIRRALEWAQDRCRLQSPSQQDAA
jgi:hypothetical protein